MELRPGEFSGILREKGKEWFDMVIRACGKGAPTLAPTARLAETAAVIGDVRLGEGVSVWYGAVLRGDDGPIQVGDGSNIQDGAVLHGSRVAIGREVTVGHGAIVHGCTVEDGCLIGMGATLLDGCVIGRGSIIAAGALVPPGKIIPPGSLVMGVPGKVIRVLSEEERQKIKDDAAHYVEAGREELPLVPRAE